MTFLGDILIKLNKLEILQDEAYNNGINIKTVQLPEKINGIYYADGVHKPLIAINEILKTQAEKTCVLAEELGHFHTSCGNLLTDPSVDGALIRKQENIAKKWAIKKLVSLKNIIKAYKSGARNMHEMAEYLDVTEHFLVQAFEKYNAMYGKYKIYGKYIVYFDPPAVLKMLELKGVDLIGKTRKE